MAEDEETPQEEQQPAKESAPDSTEESQKPEKPVIETAEVSQRPPRGKKSSVADKVLKRKLDPALQKQLDAEQLDFDKEEEEEDEAQAVVQKSSLQDRERIKRKKKFRIGMVIIALPLFAYLVHWLFKPFESDMRFGLCRVFLELYVRYPDRLVLSNVDEKRDFVRIWYMQYDAFGQERMENIECHHAYDENGNYYISKVFIDRREIEPERVAKFNTSIDAIVAYPPDLTYPRRLTDALGNVDIQTYLFRKPLF